MLQKLTIFLTLALLIQGYYCKTNADILVEYGRRIVKLQIDTSLAIKNAQIQIGLTGQFVGESVGNAEEEIQQSITSLRILAKELEEKATAAGGNFNNCWILLNKALSTVDRQKIGECASVLANLDNVRELLQELRDLKNRLSASIRQCLSSADLETCLANELDVDSKKLDTVSTQISDELNNIVQTALNCIEINSTDLQVALSKIQVELQNCASTSS